MLLPRAADRPDRGCSGRPVESHFNPRDDAVINYALEPGRAWETGWRWVNWCGASGLFTVEATLEDHGQKIELATERVPPCLLEGAPTAVNFEPAGKQ